MFMRRLKILFVDDQKLFSEPIADYLHEQYQHEMTLVPTGERAQQELLKNKFDIIFLDYRLPGASGIEVLRWIGQQRIDTPVVFVTGQADDQLAAEAMRLGAYDYVRKTEANMDILAFAINRTFERYVLRKAQEELEAEKIAHDKNSTAIKVFQETVHSFIASMNLDIENILLRVRLFEKQRKVKRSIETAEKELAQLLSEVEFRGTAIQATMQALVGLSQSVTQLHDVQKKAVDLRMELEKTLKSVDERVQKVRMEKQAHHAGDSSSAAG